MYPICIILIDTQNRTFDTDIFLRVLYFNVYVQNIVCIQNLNKDRFQILTANCSPLLLNNPESVSLKHTFMMEMKTAVLHNEYIESIFYL